MPDRTFRLRIQSDHWGERNETVGRKVDIWREEAWEPLELSVDSPGFLIFVYANVACRHRYLAANAAERGIELSCIKGILEVKATQDWRVQKAHSHFDAKVRRGEPSAEAEAYIIQRMLACPVSRNIDPRIERTAHIAWHT